MGILERLQGNKPDSLKRLQRFCGNDPVFQARQFPGTWIAVNELSPLQSLLFILGLVGLPKIPAHGVIFDPVDEVYFCLPGSKVFHNRRTGSNGAGV